MKNVLFIITILISLWMNFANAHALPQPTKALQPPTSSLQPVDRIVAIVNDQVITESQLQSAIHDAKQQSLQMGATLPDSATMRKIVLQQLIYQKLQLQLAKRNNITVSDAQVNQAIASIAKRNGLTVAGLKSKIQQQGFTFKQFHQQIKNQLIISQLQRQAVAPMIKIDDHEIKQYLKKYKQKNAAHNKQYHVIDILIPELNSTGLAQAKLIVKQLRAGTLISKITKGQVTSNDMGWQSSAGLPNIFLKQLQKMRAGQISNPIKAGNGYHVLKLAATRTGSGQTPSEDQVRQILFQQKFQKTLHDWLEKIKSQSTVKILHER